MKENDVIGCGFKGGEDQSGKASVFFTYNGDRIAEELDGVQAGLWPVLHIQKKVTPLRPMGLLNGRLCCRSFKMPSNSQIYRSL